MSDNGRMRAARIFIVVCLLVVVALAASGWSLSPQWQVQVQASVKAPPAAVLAWAGDLRHWPLWSSWPSSMRYQFGNPAAGKGANLRWDDGSSSGRIQITDFSAGQQLVYVQQRDHSERSRRCQLAVQPLAAGTQMRWHCHGELGANPFDRLLMYYIKPRIAADMQRSLQRLATHFTQAKPGAGHGQH